MKTNTTPHILRSLLLGGLGVLFSAAAAQAQIILNSYDRGNYNPTTGAYYSNSYQTGELPGSSPVENYRSFFVFDASSLSGTVTSASLKIKVPANGVGVSGGSSETLQILSVPGTIASPYNYAGLNGSSTNYANFSINDSHEGTFISIALNNTFETHLNDFISGDGSLFALTGYINGGSSGYEFAFWNSLSSVASDVQLVLDGTNLQQSAAPLPGSAVPEPSTYGLIGAGVLLSGVFLRRRLAGRTK